MQDKLVTLIGGGGFLGRYVAQQLLQQGARVRIAQRDPRAAEFLRPLGGLGQTQFVAVDIAKPDSLARALQGSDAVVNLVGILSGDFQAIQVDGARNVAAAAAATGASALVHVSAIGADPASASNYGRTKGEGEAAVRAAFPVATILRPSIVFGREDQFVNRFAGLIARAPAVPVLRTATRFQPVYVADVASAVCASLADPAAFGGKIFELGGPDILSMGALIRWIAQAIGRHPAIIELPDSIGGLIAMMGFLPGAPITQDQWRMLQSDNVVAPSAEGLGAFGIMPTPLASVAPSWLVRYRRHGRFSSDVTG
ncbi:complex I NDUFA9 subunit family protein [Sphingomonas sp. 28-63-12]|uniref:complex I NDUFA9 subunit family protein n=1 Tax=Sphingomonas sp. 28-63-12 TaxID=1970434 RepID=UPI000BD8C1E2|nr:MAG: complex I NDUFA9 subunit family protein [Sphingomonas sp. 28-63-12]